MYATGHHGNHCRPGSKAASDARPPSAAILRYDPRTRNWVKEDARACRQTRAGWRQNSHRLDVNTLAEKPVALRWLIYALAGLTVCGLLPVTLVVGLNWFTDAFQCEWLAPILLGAALYGICFFTGRDL